MCDDLVIPSFSDTVTRSGMFCATATVIDRCKTEGVVDVFQVVKALRVQKPGAVPTLVSASCSFVCAHYCPFHCHTGKLQDYI